MNDAPQVEDTVKRLDVGIQALRQQVRETRALTAKPFAVNLNLEFPQEVGGERSK